MSASEISLPIYPQMTDAMVDRVIEIMNSSVRRRRTSMNADLPVVARSAKKAIPAQKVNA